MKNNYKYNTLEQRSEGEYKEKGSKFIGIAQACYNEEEAKELLSEWKKEHHQAGHLCYAYRFRLDKTLFRTNDDGEPSNSAGAPILGQIQSYDLTNLLIGVVRYYGGTKLGVGGLINAYRTAAKEAIENGKIIEEEVSETWELSFNYVDMPHIMHDLKEREIRIIQQSFENHCFLLIHVPLSSKKLLLKNLTLFESLEIKELNT